MNAGNNDNLVSKELSMTDDILIASTTNSLTSISADLTSDVLNLEKEIDDNVSKKVNDINNTKRIIKEIDQSVNIIKTLKKKIVTLELSEKKLNEEVDKYKNVSLFWFSMFALSFAALVYFQFN